MLQMQQNMRLKYVKENIVYCYLLKFAIVLTFVAFYHQTLKLTP